MNQPHFLTYIATLTFGVLMSDPLIAQRKDVNYDEGKIDIGVLPDPLVSKAGKRITAKEWDSHRLELLHTLSEHQFGFAPTEVADLSWKVVEEGIMNEGLTKRQQIVVHLQTVAGSMDIDLIVFSPANKTKCGAFLGLNFQGNHSIDSDKAIRIPSTWMRNNAESGVAENRATETGRGQQSRRWPIREINERGFVVATAYYGDIDPDFDDGFKNGVHSLFPSNKPDIDHPDRWGSIAGWSWGLSRLLDVLIQQPSVDPTKVAVVGHSRLGKASLWAGATDPRFSVVISNNSGCGGAALERRNFGETVAIINTSFPHWFCGNFKKYNKNEKELPHDAHTLISVIAPRPVYIASATEDTWADPKGEYLSGHYATPVYQLLGYDGLVSSNPPEPEVSVGGRIGYHARTGPHDILSYDWQRFMDFSDKSWKK
jgi:hypothetical protein